MKNGTNVPTIVLVHGGFADASFWTPVIQELQARGLPVLAPPNPLRGLAGDAEYIASFVNQIEGPVLLVGHSYGGAVISVAGAAADNAVGLVYVAAFILDEGESFGEVFAGFPDTPLLGAVRPGNYPLPDGGTAVELSIAPELYRSAFAADLPAEVTEVLAVMQRPFAAIFDDRAQAAAWKTLPSWAVVATADNAIHPDAERHMARRAGADTIEVDASHSIALSQPKAVVELIQTAVDATSRSAADAVSISR
jgi:pimeloyl-ACP methyl ester carboxylesterase